MIQIELSSDADGLERLTLITDQVPIIAPESIQGSRGKQYAPRLMN